MKSYARATNGIKIGTMAADQSAPIKRDIRIETKLPTLSPSKSERRT
jgi:hypothetical protein